MDSKLFHVLLKTLHKHPLEKPAEDILLKLVNICRAQSYLEAEIQNDQKEPTQKDDVQENHGSKSIIKKWNQMLSAEESKHTILGIIPSFLSHGIRATDPAISGFRPFIANITIRLHAIKSKNI